MRLCWVCVGFWKLYVFVCGCVWLEQHVWVYTWACIYMWVYIYVCMYESVCLDICICAKGCVWVYVYVSVSVGQRSTLGIILGLLTLLLGPGSLASLDLASKPWDPLISIPQLCLESWPGLSGLHYVKVTQFLQGLFISLYTQYHAYTPRLCHGRRCQYDMSWCGRWLVIVSMITFSTSTILSMCLWETSGRGHICFSVSPMGPGLRICSDSSDGNVSYESTQ